MATKIFKQGDVYCGREGDRFAWADESFTMSRPPLLCGLLACGSQGTTIGENKVRSLLAGGLIAIHREVPDEPGEWEAHDIKRLANSDESADGLTSTVERVWLRKVKP